MQKFSTNCLLGCQIKILHPATRENHSLATANESHIGSEVPYNMSMSEILA